MRRYTVTVGSNPYVIDVHEVSAQSFQVHIEGRTIEVRLDDHTDLAHAAISPDVQIPQAAVAATPPPAPAVGAATAAAPTPPPATSPAAGAPAPTAGTPGLMTAPMPGAILSVAVGVGDHVDRGDVLMVLEAMKMKNELRASRAGSVAEVFVEAGRQVRHGDPLVRLADD